MSGRDHQNEFDGPEKDGFDFSVKVQLGDKGKFILLLKDALRHILRVPFIQNHFDTRESPLKFGEQRRHDVTSIIFRCPNLKRPPHQFLEVPHFLICIRYEIENLLCILVEELSCFGQLYLFPYLLNQFQIQRPFQGFDLDGDGRLGHIQLFCCASKTFSLNN